MTILVTGASGHLGRLVVASLLARGVAPASIRAGARDTAKIADLAALGVQTVRLDYTDAATVAAAVDGVDRVLLISGSEVGQRVAQHAAVISAAAEAGVAQLVYTSAPRATTTRPRPRAGAQGHRGGDRRIGASRDHPAEQLVHRELPRQRGPRGGVGRAVRRAPATAGWRAPPARTSPRPPPSCSPTDGHLGQVYELGGDVAWNFDELAAALGEVAGREVVYTPLTSEEHAAQLAGFGLDEGTIGFVTALDANIRDGALADTDGDLSRLIGRPTTPLLEGLRAGVAAS